MIDMPPPGVLQGRDACAALLRRLLCDLGATPTDQPPDAPPPREVLMADIDFSAWPLDEPAVLQSLAGWLRPVGRRLRIVGLDFDAIGRLHPKFARWRRDWSHRIEVWRPANALLAPGQRLLLLGPFAVQWMDTPTERLRLITDSVHVAALHEQSADFLQRCEPAWPVTTLGL